jgi:hypothetical protein
MTEPFAIVVTCCLRLKIKNQKTKDNFKNHKVHNNSSYRRVPLVASFVNNMMPICLSRSAFSVRPAAVVVVAGKVKYLSMRAAGFRGGGEDVIFFLSEQLTTQLQALVDREP